MFRWNGSWSSLSLGCVVLLLLGLWAAPALADLKKSEVVGRWNVDTLLMQKQALKRIEKQRSLMPAAQYNFFLRNIIRVHKTMKFTIDLKPDGKFLLRIVVPIRKTKSVREGRGTWSVSQKNLNIKFKFIARGRWKLETWRCFQVQKNRLSCKGTAKRGRSDYNFTRSSSKAPSKAPSKRPSSRPAPRPTSRPGASKQ